MDADDLLGGLDDAQREAVTTDALPLCILAGAGSGKTRVLTRRIAWRAATEREDPRRVLALTFTRAAARELRTRLRFLGLRDGVTAGTFHAVAWAELRATWDQAGTRPPVLLDRPARLLADTAQLSRPEAIDTAAELGWMRSRGLDPDGYVVAARRAERTPVVGIERVAALVADYERAKKRRGVVDYDDLLEHLAEAIERQPGLAAAQRFRFAHLYVDELQDLNPLQHRLLEAWRGGRPALCGVGDPNQAIYAWNGAEPSYVERFTDRFGGTTVVIDRNYRSSPEILAVANAVLDAGGLGGVRLRAVRAEGPVPVVAGYADADEEARAVARAVLDGRAPGSPWSHQAVLARTHAQLAPIEEALRAVGVPVRRHGADRLGDQPAVVAWLKELDGAPSFDEAVAALARRVEGDDAGPDDELPGSPELPGAGTAAAGADEAALRRLLDLATEYRRGERRPDAIGFRAHLTAEEATAGSGDGVDLRTFHAAKGLEWPTVHLVGAEDGLVPLARARTHDALAEERRLFYVACTRAERVLRVTWAATRSFGDGAPARRRPSPYLGELEHARRRLETEQAPGDWRSGLAAARAALAAARPTEVSP